MSKNAMHSFSYQSRVGQWPKLQAWFSKGLDVDSIWNFKVVCSS